MNMKKNLHWWMGVMHTRITNLATLTAVSYVIVKMKMEKAMSIKNNNINLQDM